MADEPAEAEEVADECAEPLDWLDPLVCFDEWDSECVCVWTQDPSTTTAEMTSVFISFTSFYPTIFFVVQDKRATSQKSSFVETHCTNFVVFFFEVLKRNRESEPGRPTEAELRILHVLWTQGPSTVRDVHERLKGHRDTGYTTTLKLLQTMHAKGLVRRDDEARAHVFEAVPSREEAQHGLVGDVLDLAFGGSAKALVLNALSSRRASLEELAEIKREIERLQKEAKA